MELYFRFLVSCEVVYWVEFDEEMKETFMRFGFLNWATLIAIFYFLMVDNAVIAQSNEEDLVYSLHQAVMANNLAIDKYDVITTERFLSSARKKEDEEIFSPTETVTISRIVMDRASKKCLRVARRYGESQENRTWTHFKSVNSQNPYYWIDYFENGKSFQSAPGYKSGMIRESKKDFYGFCRSAQIPFIEMSTWFESHRQFGRPLEDEAEISAWHKEQTTMRILGDGSISLTHEPLKAPGVFATMSLDNVNKMPVTKSLIDTRKGYRDLVYRCDFELEIVNGIHRIKSMNIEKGDLGPDYSSLTKAYDSDLKKPQRSILLTAIGTIEVEWIQFNEEILKFPSLEDFGTDRAGWVKFLKLGSTEIEKDAQLRKSAK